MAVYEKAAPIEESDLKSYWILLKKDYLMIILSIDSYPGNKISFDGLEENSEFAEFDFKIKFNPNLPYDK